MVASQSTKKRKIWRFTPRRSHGTHWQPDSLHSPENGRAGARWKPSLTIDLIEELHCALVQALQGSTVISPTLSAMSKHDSHLPPSPARTVFEDSIRESGIGPIDIAKANEHVDDELQDGQARTPLLPPLMVDFPAHLRESPIQSPLPFSHCCRGFHHIDHSHSGGYPKTTGFTFTATFNQTVDVLNASPNECCRRCPLQTCLSSQWTISQTKSGETNWATQTSTSTQSPYLPETIDVESYKQLRANWDLARCNYARHLVRADEHYGATSKIYKLTEEKWAEVDEQWKRCNATVPFGLGRVPRAKFWNLASQALDLFLQSRSRCLTILRGNFPNWVTRILLVP